MKGIDEALASIRERLAPLREEVAKLEQAETALLGILGETPPEKQKVYKPSDPGVYEPVTRKRWSFPEALNAMADFLREQKAYDKGISALEKELGLGTNTHGRKAVLELKGQGLITTAGGDVPGAPTRVRWVGGDRVPRTSRDVKPPRRQLAPGQAREGVVRALSEAGSVVGLKELARLAGVPHGSVHGTLIALEKEGAIEIERTFNGNQRQVIVHWKTSNGVPTSSVPQAIT